MASIEAEALKLVKAAAHRAIDKAKTFEELEWVPTRFLLSSEENVSPATGKKRPRIRKRAHSSISRKEADEIRKQLSKFERGSKEYRHGRDEIARMSGYSRRQVAAVVGGLERAAKRKKTLRKKANQKK